MQRRPIVVELLQSCTPTLAHMMTACQIVSYLPL